MVTVPFPPFEPDKQRFNSGAMPNIINVIPHSDGWAPMPSFMEFTPALEILTDENGDVLVDENGDILVTGPDGAAIIGDITLPEDCLGAIMTRLPSGATRIFAGTQTGLFEFGFDENTWTDVSGPSAPYAVATGAMWAFTKFGTTLYAQNGADTEQFIDLAGGTAFADTVPFDVLYPVPTCRYAAVVGDFMVRACLDSDNTSLAWSSVEDPTYVKYGTDGADIQVTPDGNEITGIIPVSSGAIIFCRNAIWALNFALSSGFVFTEQPITKHRGALAPYSICVIGQDDFVFYSQDGFFRGASQNAIGAERVDRWFLSVTSEESRQAMTASNDYVRKTVWFRYADSDGVYHLLGYNWQLDKWCFSEANAIYLFPAETAGITIDGLDAIYATIDDISASIDSLGGGGAQELAAVTPEGYLAYLTGANLEATIETNEISFNGTSRAMVNGGRLDTDAINPTVQMMTTDYKGASFNTRPAISPSARTRSLSLRGDGRTHKFKVNIPSGENWSIISGIDIDVVGTGKA